ncbi:MAG: hypothetical protein LBI96_05610, partial [Odoribacteraceae bacterium]|nr:hypothetical protein [Odoribacteraceae bacterium]
MASYTRQMLLALVAFFLPVASVAQFVDLGQDPASVRWRQIETSDFQLIYPDFFEQNALHLARLYEKLYAHANSLGIRAGKISIIIRANGGISNGNAGWAPKKSELYTTPPQDPDIPWLEHLCIHEFRHVVQYDKLNHGFSRVLYYIFGEQYTMALVGLFVPMWLLEGDATVFETAATKGGRGRSPEFLNTIKARVVERGIDPYAKALLGSYRDIIPDRYTLGYYLVANGRLHHGNALWSEVFDRIGRRPYTLFPVATGLRRVLANRRDSLWSDPAFRAIFTNPDSVKRVNTRPNTLLTFYRDNLAELQQLWTREAAAIHHHFDTIPTPPRPRANYHSPAPDGNGNIIAYKEGLAEAGAFVTLRDGRESVIFRPGALHDYTFALRRGIIAWSEYKPHARWEHAGKMTIATYDTRARRYRRHPAPVNRFAPFAAGDDAWGFVEIDPRGQAAIVLVDSAFKRETFRLRADDGELFIHPSHDGCDNILFISITTTGKRVETVNTTTGQRRPLTPDTFSEIDHPVVAGNHFIYRAAYNANNALYRAPYPARQPDAGQQIAEARFGTRYPAVAADTLYFSFYTPDGYRPASLPFADFSPREIDYRPFPLADSMTRAERWNFAPPSPTDYPSAPYHRAARAINPHSWGIIFPDRDNVTVHPGLAISSQNVLGALYGTAGYVWDDGYEGGNWKINLNYRALRPTFHIELTDGAYRWTRLDRHAINPAGQPDTVTVNNRGRLVRLDATIALPVNLARGGRQIAIRPYIRHQLQAIHHDNITRFTARSGNAPAPASPSGFQFDNPAPRVQILQYGLTFQRHARLAERDIRPRWGQQIGIGYAHAPFRDNLTGHTWWIEGELTLPGVARPHAISLYAGRQRSSGGTSSYSNQVLSPRGVSLRGYSLATARATYTLPVAYPDLQLTPLLYIKRLTAGLFLDAGFSTAVVARANIGNLTTTIT